MYSTKLKLPNFEIWPTKTDSVWLAILSKQYFYAIRILHCIWNVRMLPKISWLLLLPFKNFTSTTTTNSFHNSAMY